MGRRWIPTPEPLRLVRTIRPCECCGFPTIGDPSVTPFVCSTCAKVATGEWEPSTYPGQPTKAEVVDRLHSLHSRRVPDAG